MDLPGTYALGAVSEDQWVARQALLDAQPDAVVVVVDATRLERNLYLPMQLLDLGFPVVIALNLVDEARRAGLAIDHARLGRLLGTPLTPTVATRGLGLDALVATALRTARAGQVSASVPRYGRKTLAGAWYRFKDFLFVATPVVLIGSLVLGFVYETGLLWAFTRPLGPVVEGWLGLPAVAGLTLMFAVLRKELALQLLVALAIATYGSGVTDLLQFMDRTQIFTYALVNTIYIPCIATIAVLAREVGWRRGLAVSGFTVVLALLVGGIARRLVAF